MMKNIDWLLLSAIPVKGYIKTVLNLSGMAAGVAVAIIVVVLIISVILNVKFVSRPLKMFARYMKSGEKLEYENSSIDEIAQLEEELNE